MQIDRSNYEIWFIDWLDGILNIQQVEQLELFLNQNPDLREEFSDLTTINLVPSGISFRNKEHLKKSVSDISPSQFNYLCAAYLENDLSEIQKTELREIVDNYPDKKKTFDLMLKTRLLPARISYKHKSLLLKLTPAQKVIRLSVIGLSTAAAIALIIITYSILPATTSIKVNSSARNVVSDSTIQSPSPVIANNRILKDSISVPAKQKKESRLVNIGKEESVTPNSDLRTGLSNDSLAGKINNEDIIVKKVPVYRQVELRKEIVNNTLVASNATFTIPEDERSDIGRFISKKFRETFLKEKTPPDSPLKGFEIAEAGVTGLNKLFGWEMALDKKNDENGQTKSVYFSSKILKFNAPVKKSEPVQ